MKSSLENPNSCPLHTDGQGAWGLSNLSTPCATQPRLFWCHTSMYWKARTRANLFTTSADCWCCVAKGHEGDPTSRFNDVERQVCDQKLCFLLFCLLNVSIPRDSPEVWSLMTLRKKAGIFLTLSFLKVLENMNSYPFSIFLFSVLFCFV